MRNRITVFILFAAMCISPAPAMAGEDSTVLSAGADALLYDSLLDESREHYDRRAAEVEDALKSPEAIALRQQRLLEDYRRLIGELPGEKAPLEARVTGVVECDDYRIEKVYFESRPNHRVTANLYVPTKEEGPFPGIAMPCGHSANGKACEAYQSACILLAKNGLVVLIYDPISQGERHQVLAAPRHGTTTHAMLNVGSLLVGRTIVGYEAWDGIRAIDYLLTRDEVDGTKPVGLTGNSGGGTQTNFLMALDSRVGPAAPSCYVMQKQRKYETLGPADGCQHFPEEVACGIDHVDYFWMRAPKPTLLLAAERDFFEFASTRAAAEETKRLYAALDKPERTALFSFDDGHGFSKPRREAATRWMRRWLSDDPAPVVEPELTLQTDATLQVTKTGQVVSDFETESTVNQMNSARAKTLAKDRAEFWKSGDRPSRLATIRRMIGVSQRRGRATVEKKGTIQRDGYAIEKCVLRREGAIPVPALWFVPEGKAGNQPPTLHVDSRGKAADAAPGGKIEKLVRGGRVVLSIDVQGFGETADKGSKGKYYNVEHRVANLAMHLGRPLLGRRVDDILAAADVLARRYGVGEIDLAGVAAAGPVVLHAAALDERFDSLTLSEPIPSWVDDFVAKPLARDLMGHVVPRALLKYDLPDLVHVIRPRKVTVPRKEAP